MWTHTWSVQIMAQTVIAVLDPTSIYREVDPATGLPWAPGKTNAEVAVLIIKNAGSMAGTLSWRCYAHADTANETLLNEGTTVAISPGQSAQVPVKINIPNEPGTACPFGVKVKGQTEPNWPDWGNTSPLNTYMFGKSDVSDNNLLLFAGVAVAAGIGIAWYLSKKKR